MPCFVEYTPFLELVIRNPFSGRKYPSRGKALAVIDTGYEGFLLVPGDIFDELFREIESESRRVILADGREVVSRGTYGEVLLETGTVDGFVETIEGVDELVAGADLLKSFRLELNYCTRTAKIERCKKPYL